MKRSRSLIVILLILALLLLALPMAFSCKEQEKDNGHAHVFGEWTVVKAPTCNKSGTKVRVCSCGKKETASISPEHSGEWEILAEPTCTAGGFRYRKCELCGAEEREAMEPLGHEGEWLQTLAPTCDEPGKRSRVCTRCGKTQNDTIAPIGHQYGDWTVLQESTCKTGLKERVCTVCGVHEYADVPADYSLHQFGEDGVCSLCGEHAASHGFVFVPINENSLALNAYTGDETEVYVPSYCYGAKVTCIYATAFRDNKNITSVVIPTSVTDIEEGTFSGCSSLVSLTIPFVGSHYEIPSEEPQEVLPEEEEQKPLVEHPFGVIFGKRPFDDSVEVLQNYVGEDGLRLVGIYHLPASLRNVTVTGGKIVDGAFYGCSMLTSITLPSYANEIGSYAFEGCGGLTSLALPASVSKIAPDAFKNCSALRDLSFGQASQLRTIGFGAFFGCSALESLEIPSTVNSIGTNALASCSELTTISFEGTVEAWAAVTKGKGWNPKNLPVTCTDGVAEK